MDCIKQAQGNHSQCRAFSKAYLQCRMDHGLMAKDDMKNLGFWDLEETSRSSTSNTERKEELG